MAKQSPMSFAALDDMCNWEFVDRSDFDLDGDDDDSVFEVESVDLVESLDSLCFSLSSSEEEEDKEEEDGPIGDIRAHDDDDAVMGSVSPPFPTHIHDAVNCDRVIDLRHLFDGNLESSGNFVSDVYDDGGHQDDDDDVDEEEDDHGYDVDDELVPWDVKDRFERQRIRKLGKRAFAKMTKSKKSVLLYTKPGCVRGKHGLGLKAY